MSYGFPEQPMLVYPSLAERFGLEEALLLGAYHQLAQRIGLRDRQGNLELKLDPHSWQQLVPFWDQNQLASVTSSLVSQGAIEASMSAIAVKVLLLEDNAQTGSSDGHKPPMEPVITAPPMVEPKVSVPSVAQPEVRSTEVVRRLPVRNQPPSSDDAPPLGVARRPEQTIVTRTPAPSFGGSTGWTSREQKREQRSEFHIILDSKEEEKKKLLPMHIDWQPPLMFYKEFLPRSAIPEAFAKDCIDQFILYWLEQDKNKSESGWCSVFLKHVKNQWEKKQGQNNRDQRHSQHNQTGFNHENTRRDSREKRKRVTQAIMDIKDTDW